MYPMLRQCLYGNETTWPKYSKKLTNHPTIDFALADDSGTNQCFEI